ncbi:MAG: hypothetical protein HC880_11070, partial [Bacteroidia bacterium]|nr:hypothetical protein [Bacteroidia bacterium]
FEEAAPPFAVTDNPVMAYGRYFENASNYHSTTSAFDTQLENLVTPVPGIAPGDYIPDVAPTGLDVNASIDTWFTPVDFIGAIKCLSGLTSTWTR